jgi:hypothetical protein
MTALRAQGWCGFDGVMGSGTLWGWWHRGLGEHDGVGQRCCELENGAGCTVSRAWDGVCVLGDVTGFGRGRWWHVKGPRTWSGTMVWRLRGGHDDSMGSGEVNDGTSSREIFGGKFYQPDGVSESLWEIGFAMAAQRFIYRGTTVATNIGDVIRDVATENHSSDRRLQSSACC